MTSETLSPQLKSSPSLFAHYVLGVTPHATQAEFLECRAPVKVAACGRRWGKSVAASIDAVHLAVTGDAGGKSTVQMICAPTSDQCQIIAGETERLLLNGPLSGMVADIVHNPFIEIKLTNGSLIMARSTGDSGRNIRGRGADRVICDEAAFMPQDVISQVISPMLADTSGQLVLVSTPFGKNDFFQRFMQGQGENPACKSFRFPSYLNPHVSREYIEAQRQTMTSMQFETEWEAAFLDDLGTVFGWTLIERATKGELAGPVIGHSYALGWDPSKWHDRSAVIVLDITHRPWHVVACECIQGRDYTRQLSRVINLSRSYNDAFVIMDSTSNESLLEQLLACGVPTEGVRFTNASKQGLIDGLVLALEQGNITFPHLPDLLTELRYYSYTLTGSGNVRLGAPNRAGTYDDLATALALATKAVMDIPEQAEIVSLQELLDETMDPLEWSELERSVAGPPLDPRY